MSLKEEEEVVTIRSDEGSVYDTSKSELLVPDEGKPVLHLGTLVISMALFTVGLGFHFAMANQAYFVSKQTGIPFHHTVLAIEMADLSAPFAFFATPWLIKLQANTVMALALGIAGCISFVSAINSPPEILVFQLAITRFIYGFCIRLTAAWLPATINKFMLDDLKTTGISINQSAFSLKVLMFMATGLVLKYWGWQAAFVLVGGIQIPIGGAFYLLMPDKPLQDPLVNTSESQSLLGRDNEAEQRDNPWNQLVTVISDKYVLAISLCGFIAGFIQVSTYVLVGVWFPEHFGLDSFEVGLATMAVTVGSLIGLVAVVYLDAVIPPKIATVYTFVLFLASLVSMILLHSVGKMTLFIAFMYVAVLGFTWAFFFSRGIFVAMEFAPTRQSINASISLFKISSPLGAFAGGSIVPMLWMADNLYGVVGGMAAVAALGLITTIVYNLLPPRRE